MKKYVIPQFYGYSNYPSWPPTGQYSKWMLISYKPWRNSVEELKLLFVSYKRALMKYMWIEEFSRTILLTILQCKLNISSNVDLNEGAEIIAPTCVGIEGN